MPTLDLGILLTQLDSVSDQQIHESLAEYSLSIKNEKYETAFSCMGMAYWIGALGTATPYKPAHVPTPPSIARIHRQASLVFKLFVSLLFMRSEHLERGLDNVSDSSPLDVFRRVFRSGSMKRRDDTITQHLRNALAHGTFQFSPDCSTVRFEDRQSEWKVEITVEQLDRLCEHVHRFYDRAFGSSGEERG